MAKKGFIGGEHITGWLAGLVIVGVIILFLVGPEQLYSKAKNALFSYGSGVIPEEKNPPAYLSNPRVSIEIEKYFDSLASELEKSLKDLRQPKDCWISIGQMPNLNNFNIIFSNNKMRIEKNNERGLSPAEKIVNVEGLKPCSIRGSKARNFYDCFTHEVRNCNEAYESGDFALNKDTKIAPFLYRFNGNNICFIFIGDFDFLPKCNTVETGVDGNCLGAIDFDTIKINYPSCSATGRIRR